MTKKIAIIVSLVLASILFLYQDLGISGPTESNYHLLAVLGHGGLTPGPFAIDGYVDSEKVATPVRKDSRTRRTIFAPAIPTVAIGKFLNGNMPVTTPDDVAGPFAPALLSQTGAFSNLVALVPAPGLVPFEMVEPFWSDGAAKTRWMAIPNDGTHDTADEQIQLNAETWGFPKGAVLIKHFELGGKRLETRLEVKGDDDIYYYLTYKWNTAQTDATLLNASLDEDILVDGNIQSWHYPSRVECAACHFPQNGGGVLGPKTRNLNKSITYPNGAVANQLVNLSEMGIIPETITNTNVGNYMTVAAKNNLSASLEDRARTYIDMNCSSCHNPAINNIAIFDARFTTPLENQNIIYGEVSYDLGLDEPKVVIPQDVANSAMHFRMNSTQANVEMPPLAKDVTDTAGVQLIADWINSLTPITSGPPVAILSASTTNGTAPLSVDFDASASSDPDGDPLTYEWNFGDGSTAQGVNINHIYIGFGSYTATLTINDGQNTSDDSTRITVTNNPSTNTVAFTESTALLQGDNYSGLVMAIADMNGDGKDDIVQFDNGNNLRIQYQNGAEQNFNSYNFGNVSTKRQWSTTIADIDHNGYNDILCGGYYDGIKIISNNNGINSYTSQKLPRSNIFIQGSNFVDIDNDGWADIFACNDDAESKVYTNNQDGSFIPDQTILDTKTVPGSDNSGNYASMWVDYDNDGDQDLYISKCKGGVTDPTDPRRVNMLMQNDGNNNFTEVAEQANLKNGEQTWLTDFGDIDNDGDLDAIIINHGSGANLMRNNGDGTFTEITAGSGLLPTLEPENLYGVQGFFKDFNNDGYLDLLVSGDNHYLFYNKGDGSFQLAPNPFNSNSIQSFVVGDLNHDGFLDIYAGYATGLNTPTTTKDKLWLNQGNNNNYINVQLTGVQSNINGIGARVELYGPWGIQIRDVKSGEGYGVMNTFTQHFGISTSTQIDKVIVRWPSGTVDEILNPSPNQFLSITEGNHECDDSDGDGICDTVDRCEGYNDNLDADSDGVPDGCDICTLGDDNLDADGDGVPDSCDICEGYDDKLDADSDGVPDGCDICTLGDDNLDTDGDGVPDSCDRCKDHDDSLDADGDGVPDDCDTCTLGDDNLDTDGDGIPDNCDKMPSKKGKSNLNLYPNPTNKTLNINIVDFMGTKVKVTMFDSANRLLMTTYFDANHTASEQLYLDSYPVGVYHLLFEIQNEKKAKTFIIKRE